MTDRDRSIERLLRRAGASNDERATECLDAETLAALADDTLPAAVRRDAEAHLADCDRCQALTAAMVRTDATGTMAVEVSRTRRAFNWLVPAAAAATAVALWVLVPDQQTPPAAPAISDQQTTAAPPAAAVGAERRDSRQSLDSRATPQNEAAPTAPTATLADRPSPPPAELARPSPAGPEERQEALKVEELASRDSAGNVQSPPAESVPVGGSLQASAPAPPSASAPARDTGARETDAVAQQRAAAFRASAAVDIASPNPRIRWRVGPAGTVQRTEDQGATWASQQTGVTAELIAGSSPAADVCWIVGRGGIVLRTVDAGRSWQRAALPDAADAVAVTASTGVDAVVTLAGGRRVATSDGGRSWVPVP